MTAKIPLNAIEKGLALLPEKMRDVRAKVELVAIGLQESGFLTRRQYGNGPATGFWQFEEGGGVNGVMTHPASSSYAAAVCISRKVPFERHKVWTALETDDVLAAAFARLLLWTDPKSLPAVNDTAGAWALYLRLWRPGTPRPESWAAAHAKGVDLLT